MSHFRSLRDSILILPIVYDFDPDILLSMVNRVAIDTIGLVTGSEDSIAKIINELKRSIHFEGSFVAGTIYGKSLPLFVRESDLILYTSDSSRMVEQKVPEKSRLRLDYLLSEKSSEMIRAELWDQ